MKIRDLLKPESIIINAPVDSKDTAIEALIDLHHKAGNLNDKDAYRQSILQREEESTTAVGEGIAIPHAKSDAVKTPGLAAITVPAGIDYNAPDGAPSNLLFMIAAPVDGDLHLEVLARLMTLLMDMELRQALLSADSPEHFLDCLNAAEAAKYPGEAAASTKEETDAAETNSQQPYKLLAVTACPTGIAHTYMAAEALEQKANEMGMTMKVETNGSGGAKNVLTAEEIQAADGIIIAADKQVSLSLIHI